MEELQVGHATVGAGTINIKRYVVRDDCATVSAACGSLVPCDVYGALLVINLQSGGHSGNVKTDVLRNNLRRTGSCGSICSNSVVVESGYGRIVFACESLTGLASTELLNGLAVACYDGLGDGADGVASHVLRGKTERNGGAERCARIGSDGEILHSSRSVEHAVVEYLYIVNEDLAGSSLADGVDAEIEYLVL